MRPPLATASPSATVNWPGASQTTTPRPAGAMRPARHQIGAMPSSARRVAVLLAWCALTALAAARDAPESTAVCSELPEPAPNAEPWPLDACKGKKFGVMCTTDCADGFRGSLVVKCNADGKWSPPRGACLPAGDEFPATAAAAAAVAAVSTCGAGVSCALPSYQCRGLPTAGPPIADATYWTLDKFAYEDGEMIITGCRAGFAGVVVSVCKQGAWTPPQGACWLNTNNVCLGPPATATSPNAMDWPMVAYNPWVSVYNEGSIIWAYCKPGYAGRIGAVCLTGGRWSTQFGTCTRVPWECRGPPTASPGNFTTEWPTAAKNYPDGSQIQANCIPGYAGGVRAVCNKGNWTAPLGACYKPAAPQASCLRRPTVARPINTRQWDSTIGGYCDNRDGGFCTANCRTGSSGVVLTVCRNGTWSNTTGACSRVPVCRRQPTVAPSNSTGWPDCTNTPAGGSCVGYCREGYVGAPVSVCQPNGTWGTPVGYTCTPVTSSCASGPPTLPTNANWWTRCSALEGGVCTANCAAGFKGSVAVYCRAGRWSVPIGQCYTASSCPRQPAGAPPLNSEGWYDCDTSEGGVCYAQCSPGFVGAPVVQCRAGRWSAVSGGCWADTRFCQGLPDTVPANSDGWVSYWCGSTEGSTCGAQCSTGYVGSPNSQCRNGVWGPVVGSCWKPAVSGRATCANAPDPLGSGEDAVRFPASCAGRLEGEVCWVNCRDGYVGLVWTTCLANGTWGATQGSCYRDQHYCTGPPALPPVNNNTLPWPLERTYYDGERVTAGCRDGFTGGFYSECINGTFLPAQGSCVPQNPNAMSCWGSDLPALQDTSWEQWCTWTNFPDGQGCRAPCGMFKVGYLYSTCSNGAWTTPEDRCRPNTGVCKYDDLPAVSSLANADAGSGSYAWEWPCYRTSVNGWGVQWANEGDTCRARCGVVSVYGYAHWATGAIDVTCKGGQWSVPQSTCAPRADLCDPSQLPDVTQLGASWDYYCTPPYGAREEGFRCPASCSSGQIGGFTSTCRAGVWTAAKGSCRPDPNICRAADLPDPASFGGERWDYYDWTCTNYDSGEGKACTAKCPPGTVGSPTTRCRNSQWTPVEGSCVQPYSTSCPGAALPSPESFNTTGWQNYPCYYSGWWGAYPDGQVCLGACPLGRVGSPAVLCRNGTWVNVTGLAGCYTPAVPPKTCPNPPTPGPPSVNATDWPDSCRNVPDGQACATGCKDGWSGAFLAVCVRGVWARVQGSCYRSPSICLRTATNPSAPGTNSLDWPEGRDWYYDGEAIATGCKDGWLGGFQAVCVQGRFATPTGACWRTPRPCVGPPSGAPGPNAQPWQVGSFVYPDGFIITAGCMAGLVGTFQSQCVNGTWSAPWGSCWNHTAYCPELPPPLAPELNTHGWQPDRVPGYPARYIVGAPCLGGFVGSVRAQCRVVAGGTPTWTAPYGVCERDPHVCTVLPSGRAGPNGAEWPTPGWSWRGDGAAEKTTCRAGSVGYGVAVCKMGTWYNSNNACII